MSHRFVLVGGGVRSGKSAYAVARALATPGPRAFVATARAFDDEMRARIAAHVAEREGRFVTHEAPLALAETLASIDGGVVVVDCLTLWLSNLLLRGDDERRIAQQVDEVARVVLARRFTTLLVTNEVGMGIVPESHLGRVFRDVAGRAHQRLAREADEVIAALLGVLLRLRPGPVEVLPP